MNDLTCPCCGVDIVQYVRERALAEDDADLQLLTFEEVEHRLKITPKIRRQLIREGRLRTVTITPKNVRVRCVDVRRLLGDAEVDDTWARHPASVKDVFGRKGRSA